MHAQKKTKLCTRMKMRHAVGPFVELQPANPQCHVCGNGSPVFHAMSILVAVYIERYLCRSMDVGLCLIIR
jgi:hypothetical protein